jgi:hypothetical protein
MKMLTLITETNGYQVKMVAKENTVTISVLSVDQKELLYQEAMLFPSHKIAWDYSDEFKKADAKKIVQRYLRYDPKKN